MTCASATHKQLSQTLAAPAMTKDGVAKCGASCGRPQCHSSGTVRIHLLQKISVMCGGVEGWAEAATSIKPYASQELNMGTCLTDLGSDSRIITWEMRRPQQAGTLFDSMHSVKASQEVSHFNFDFVASREACMHCSRSSPGSEAALGRHESRGLHFN